MAEPPVFGENGAVLNSDTMTNELRAEHESGQWPREELTPRGLLFYALMLMIALVVIELATWPSFNLNSFLLAIIVGGLLTVLNYLNWRQNSQPIVSRQRKRARLYLGVLLTTIFVVGAQLSSARLSLELFGLFSCILLVECWIRLSTPP
ncbi:MAG: hypothetical protein AAFV54_05180 [Pseudomonadota bacterium]